MNGSWDGYEIRRRWSGDLDGCVTALAGVHQADGYPVDWPADPARWLVESDQLASWVAVSALGEIVGHVALCRGAGSSAGEVWALRGGREATEAGAVGRLYVAPSARGRGIGEGLLAAAVGQAHAWGLHPVLDVVTTSAAAVELYQRLGWELMMTVDQSWPNGAVVAVHCFAEAGGS
ncbi:GNAT family N-acetyltransferase [Kitasatospora kifunensis]|uniref:GNAT superfamily N-acetyltransferase n=1 Tax=Kitasatospora kifunensis TaxID=58351 RepID=A0A7W7R6R0_KITKI|nr:GNAT family N-acetyltransferase [Kitasatospora kifunensis]MBB4926455.1 GNAT superfamily N-acetyltransferase [Kitasatospora kifunensis]